MDNPVTQASLSAERFDLRHPCHAQEFLLTGSASLLLLGENWWGTAPRKVRGVGESIKQQSRQTLVWGVDAWEQGVS